MKKVTLLILIPMKVLSLDPDPTWIIRDEAEIQALTHINYNHPSIRTMQAQSVINQAFRTEDPSNQALYFSIENILNTIDQILSKPIPKLTLKKTFPRKIKLYTQSETQCHHFFHKHCLSKWQNCSKTCPNCREELKKIIIAGYVPKNTHCSICLKDISTVKNKKKKRANKKKRPIWQP